MAQIPVRATGAAGAATAIAQEFEAESEAEFAAESEAEFEAESEVSQPDQLQDASPINSARSPVRRSTWRSVRRLKGTRFWIVIASRSRSPVYQSRPLWRRPHLPNKEI